MQVDVSVWNSSVGGTVPVRDEEQELKTKSFLKFLMYISCVYILLELGNKE